MHSRFFKQLLIIILLNKQEINSTKNSKQKQKEIVDLEKNQNKFPKVSKKIG